MVRSPVRPKKRPQPWTCEEHSAFLMGLSTFGKGRWKDISTHYVPSRTCVQVASHAQKYYERKKSDPRKRRRRPNSVFETALVEGSDESPCLTPREMSELPESESHDTEAPDEPSPGPPVDNTALPALDHPQFIYISPLLLYQYFLMTHSMSHFYTIPKHRYPLYSQH